MKRIVLLIVALLTAAATAQQPVDVTVVVNGKDLPDEPPVIMVGDQMFVPMRAILNALGVKVGFADGMVTGERGAKSIALNPKTGMAKIDGQDVEMDTPPTSFEGSTYVPLRFIATALGDSVSYDGETKTITVSPAEDPITVPPDRITILKGRLKQLVVGNQGAILKVRNPDGSKEVYYRGLDDRATAPYDDEDHTGILNAVLLQQELARWTKDTMEAFSLLPKREAVAFLGMVYSIPNDSALDPGPTTDTKVEEFLIKVVKEHKSVIVRRQAVLSMAVGGELDQKVLEAVLGLYETSENLWETFPVQQFFQYHAEDLRKAPNFAMVRARVANVNSLYTANILDYLDGKQN